jgi:hypothetical protein
VTLRDPTLRRLAALRRYLVLRRDELREDDGRDSAKGLVGFIAIVDAVVRTNARPERTDLPECLDVSGLGTTLARALDGRLARWDPHSLALPTAPEPSDATWHGEEPVLPHGPTCECEACLDRAFAESMSRGAEP